MAKAMPTLLFIVNASATKTANNDLKPNKFYCSYTTNLKL